MSNLYVLEWSKRDNAFHVDELARSLSSNRDAYRDDAERDYIPLYVGTLQEVQDAADAARHTLDARR